MPSKARIKEMTLRTFIRTQALLKGHFVFTSGRHGKEYIHKDAVYLYVREVSHLCALLAEKFWDTRARVIVGPEKGAIILSHSVADQLIQLTGKHIVSVYAEKDEQTLIKVSENAIVGLAFQGGTDGIETFEPRTASIGFVRTGESVVIRRDAFIIKRGYEKLVSGKDVLVVEDIINTGGTVQKTIEAVRVCGGRVVGVGALCNRGNVTKADLGDISEFHVLADLPLQSWNEDECPLCRQGIAVNTHVGKGKQFLDRKRAEHGIVS